MLDAGQGPGIRRRVFVEQHAPLPFRAVEGGAVNQTGVVDGDRAGLGAERPRPRNVQAAGRYVDGPAEGPLAVVIVDRPSVRARQHHERAVLRIHRIEQDAHRQHALVGVRVEGPILMPLHRRTVAGGLDVDLAPGAQPNVVADQGLERRHQPRIRRQLAIEGVRQMRPLDAPHPGRLGPMRGFEIENVRVIARLGGGGDDAIRRRAQRGQRGGIEHVVDHDVAVPPVLRHFGGVQAGHRSLPTGAAPHSLLRPITLAAISCPAACAWQRAR